MARLTQSLLLAAWAGCSSAASLAAQVGTTYVVREGARPCARMRAGPSPDARSRGCLAPGVEVTEVGVAPFWRKVRPATGRVGWVAKQALEATGTRAATPVVAISAAAAARDDAWLEVHIVDVGQGDGIWMHTFDDGIAGNGVYEGRNIIIDGGPDGSDGKNELLKYLRRQTPDTVIDALIVTHPHDDHYPGARGILRHFQVRDYYDPGYPSTSSKYTAFRRMVAEEQADGGRPITLHIGAGQFGQPDWGSELQVDFLYAYPGSPVGLGSRDNTVVNNASIVLRVAYGSQSFLFMGDAEGKERDGDPGTARYVEGVLLANPDPSRLKSTVLKIAHHGSETSSTQPFIQAVDPSYVIVSSGRRKFGTRFLPDASTLQRYCDHNPAVRIYRTDENDAAERRTAASDADGDHILLRTNGAALLVDAYSAGTRITHTTCTAN